MKVSEINPKDKIEDALLGKKVKLLKYLHGIKKGTKIRINCVSFYLETNDAKDCTASISGGTNKKYSNFYPEDFEFLKIIGEKK